jgi:hypothetical protein
MPDPAFCAEIRLIHIPPVALPDLPQSPPKERPAVVPVVISWRAKIAVPLKRTSRDVPL